MFNRDLIEYIKQTVAQGYSEKQIKDAPLRRGWQEEEEIEEAAERKPVEVKF